MNKHIQAAFVAAALSLLSGCGPDTDMQDIAREDFNSILAEMRQHILTDDWQHERRRLGERQTDSLVLRRNDYLLVVALDGKGLRDVYVSDGSVAATIRSGACLMAEWPGKRSLTGCDALSEDGWGMLYDEARLLAEDYEPRQQPFATSPLPADLASFGHPHL